MTEGKDNSHQTAYAANEQATKAENRFISFRLSEQEYCVEILRVREIIKISNISPLPEMPEHVKGIINLRGRIIPIIELRAKFGMPSAPDAGATYAIVLDLPKGRGEQPLQIGVIVDTVSGVVDIAPDQIEPPADLGDTVNTENVQGIGKVEDRVFIILNIDSVVTKAERQTLEKSSKASAASASTAESVLDAA